jgi:hypothetical protein
MVVGFRTGADASAVDPLLREDDAVRLQTRLEREKDPDDRRVDPTGCVIGTDDVGIIRPQR